MRYLLGAAILSACLAASAGAQMPPTTTEAQARYLANAPPPSAWSNLMLNE